MQMKKIMMMALMAATATTAFAQDALVKEAKKLLSSSEYDKAVQTLTPALSSDETTDKAAAWNLMYEIQRAKVTDISTKRETEKLKPTGAVIDTLGEHNAVVGALEAALKCDEYDRQPNEKGKVKTRYRQAAQPIVKNLRQASINAGLYYYNSLKDTDKAYKTWALYVDSANDPFFEGIDLTSDKYYGDVAYYAGLAAYQNKDYANAKKYADIASKVPEMADKASEILLFSQKETMSTPADSADYVSTLKKLRKEKPQETRYFNLLQDFFVRSNNLEDLKAWTEEEIAADPSNKMVWGLKGDVEKETRQWDAAIASYKKSIELDPEYIHSLFNLGVTLNSKAIDQKDLLADKKTGRLTNENADKVRAILNEAKGYMERCKELDPNREKGNWAYPLYQIYYSLNEKEKADEMEKLVNQK